MGWDFSVSGHRVLITGGTGGIGSAFATAFLDRGADVTITGRSPDTKSCKGINYRQLDLTDGLAVDHLAKMMGPMDTIIHCAGQIEHGAEMQADAFNRVIDIHLTGALRLATAYRAGLKERGGSIINIASMYSYAGAPHIPAYAAAKTGIISLTKSLALSFAPDGIRVNAIAPGWIKTPMSDKGRSNENIRRKVLERLPQGGDWSDPEELCGTAVFLASSAARLITGVTLPVDGGYTAS